MEKVNLNDLQAKINIVDVIQKYINLTKKGNSWVGVCPFHDDTNPSLFVSEKLQVFNCFVCGTKGNAFNFVKQFKNISYNEAVIEVCESFGIQLEKNVLASLEKTSLLNQKLLPYWDACKMIMQAYHDELLRRIKQHDPLVVEFLNKRKLTSEIINHFQLGFAPSSPSFLSERVISGISNQEEKNKFQNVLHELGYLNDNNFDFFTDRIIFPIFDEDNNVVGFSGRSFKDDTTKYLNSKESLIFKKASLLFNIQTIKKNNPEKIYIAEGFMEVISLWKLGISNAVAVMGTSFGNNHIQQLKKNNRLIEIVICLDNDTPGQDASVNVARELIINPSWQISLLPEMPGNNQYKDLDELINHVDKQEVIVYLNSSINYFSWYTNYLMKKTKIADVILKKSVIASNVLMEIKNFASLNIVNALISELATKLDLSLRDLKNEFNHLKVRTKRIKSSDKSIDPITSMLMARYNCDKPNDEIVIKAKTCFFFECKIITLFFNNLMILEFAKRLKCHFVFENIYKIYQTILNNAMNEIVWDVDTFEKCVHQNDFPNHLIFDCVVNLLDSESMEIESLNENDEDLRIKMINEIIRKVELANLDLEITLKISQSYKFHGVEKKEFTDKIKKLINKKNLLIKSN